MLATTPHPPPHRQCGILGGRPARRPTHLYMLGFSLDEEREQPFPQEEASREYQRRFLSGFASSNGALADRWCHPRRRRAGRPGNAEGNMRIETVRLLRMFLKMTMCVCEIAHDGCHNAARCTGYVQCTHCLSVPETCIQGVQGPGKGTNYKVCSVRRYAGKHVDLPPPLSALTFHHLLQPKSAAPV